MNLPRTRLTRLAIVTLVALLSATRSNPAGAETVSFTSAKGQYPISIRREMFRNPKFNSNGSGNFFSAGRTMSKNQIQRGLVQFDLSDLPSTATVTPGTVSLGLYVVDYPDDDANPRPFWLVPLTGLDQPWGEGALGTTAGVSGAGSGVSAQEDDATWFHTMYDPDTHDKTTFTPGGAGFWSQKGALGNDPLDPQTLYGDPEAVAASELGPVTLSSASMEADINMWLADSSKNFGWIVLGDETVEGQTVSSKRGFASHEHDIIAYRPLLTFEYTIAAVPEPGSVALLISGTLAAALLFARRRRVPSLLA